MANCIGDFVASLSEKERDDIMNQYNGLIEKGMSDRGATAQIAMQETKKLVDDLNSLKKSIGAPTVAFAIPENINKILAIENEPIAKPIIAETSKEEHIISPTDIEKRRAEELGKLFPLLEEYANIAAPASRSTSDMLTSIAVFLKKKLGWDIKDLNFHKNSNTLEFKIGNLIFDIPASMGVMAGNSHYIANSLEEIVEARYDAELAALEGTKPEEKKKPKRPGKPFRQIGIGERVQPKLTEADIEQYKKWAHEAIPQFPDKVLDRIIQINDTEQAFGVYEDGIIKFYKGALKIVPYHEAFEAIWNTFLSPEEQDAILEQERNKNTGLSDPEIKEKIADQFGDFKLGKLPAKALGEKIVRFFKRIIEFFKTFGRKASLKTELFKAIDSGKFKEYKVPADIRTEAPVYRRVEGMTETQAYEFVQDMTIRASQFIFGEDKSLLYNIQKLTSDDVFGKIKQLYIDEDKFGDGALISSDAAWKLLVKRTKEALLPIGIRFNTEEEIDINDGEKAQNEYTKEPFTTDWKKASTFDVRITLSTLTEMEPSNQQNATSIELPEPKYSNIDGYASVSFSQVFATLLSKFSNTTNVDSLEEKFAELAKYDANYVLAFQRFGANLATGVFDFQNFTADDWRLFISFYQTFTRQHPNTVVQYREGASVYTGTSDIFSAVEEIQKDWFENIKVLADDPKSPIVYHRNDKVYRINKAAIPNVIPKTAQQAISFLNTLGIDFTKETFQKLKTREKQAGEKTQQQKFFDAVNSIYTYLHQANEIASVSGKTLGINGPMNVLSELTARVENPTQDNTHLNPEGKRVQNYADNNMPSVFENEFNENDTFEELKEQRPELNDVFSKNSVVFMKGGLFYNKEGKKIKSIKVGNIEGIKDTDTDKGYTIADLSRGDRYITELNQNLNGDYYILIPGDGSTEWKMNLGNYITYEDVVSKSGGWNKIYKVFKGYLEDDIALAMDYENREKLLNVGSRAQELRFFQDILHKDTLNGLYELFAEDASMEKINTFLEEHSKDINESVKEFITNTINETRNLLINNGRITSVFSDNVEKFAIPMLDNNFMLDSTLNKFDLSEEQLMSILTFANVNYIINNIEFHKILFGDPYQFALKNGQLEETKRIKSFLSPRRITFDHPLYNTFLNQNYNTIDGIILDPEELGAHQFKSYTSTVTLADIITDTDTYSRINEADASSLLIDTTYREIKLKNRQWSNEAENWHQWQMAYARQHIPGYAYKNESLKEHDIALLKTPEPIHTIEVLKPIVSGVKNNSKSINVVLDKFSQMPLYYKAIQGTNLKKLYMKMWKEKQGYVIMKSGRKAGIEGQHSLYNPNGTFNEAPFEAIVEVPWKAYGIQVETSYERDKGQTMGSQVTKISSLDLFRYGEAISPAAEKAYRRNLNALNLLHTNGYNRLLVKLGIEDLGIGGYLFKDKKALEEILNHEMLRRDLSNNVKDTIQRGENGEFLIPFEASPAYEKIKDILYSVVNKNIISLTLTGGPKVQAPVTLWENAKEGRSIVIKTNDGYKKITREEYDVLSEEDKGKVRLTSDTLKFYTKEHPYCEVMLPHWFKEKLGKKFKSDEAILKYLNSTEEGRSILTGIGFRIPTQAMSSIEVFRVKGFLPQFMGDTIIVPTEITAKTGSDFDIDKLNTYLKSIYIDEKGDIKLVRYQGDEESTKAFFDDMFTKTVSVELRKASDHVEFTKTLQSILNKMEAPPQAGEIESRYDILPTPIEQEFYETNINIINEIIEQADLQEMLPSEYLSEQLEKASQKEQKVFLKMLDDKLREDYVNSMYQKAVENEYYSSLEEMLTLPENFNRLLSSVEEAKKGLKNIASTLDALRGDDETTIKNRLLDRNYMTNLRHAYISSKKWVGIAAVNITGQSLTQKAKIYIDPERFSLVPAYDRGFLGDGSINLPHNKIGEFASISGDKTADGKEFISDRLSGYATAFVDAINDPYIMKIVSHSNAVGTLLFLERLGIGDNAVLFMNQPIIREYLNHLDNIGVSGLFSMGQIILIKNKFLSGVHVSGFDVKGMKTNIEDYYSEKGLSDAQNAEQIVIFDEFLKYSKMAQYAFKLTQATNYDTTKFRGGASFSRKQSKTRVAKESNIFSGIQEMLDNTFLGEHIELLDGATSSLGEILKLEQDQFTEGVLKDIIAPYEENEYLSADNFDRISNKLRASFLDYIIQTKSGINSQIRELLIDAQTSVASQLAEAKIAHPETLILKKLRVESSKRGNIADNTKTIKLDVNLKSAYDEDMYTEMLLELKSVEPVLYDNIIKLSILQGTYQSAVSIKNVIPTEDFSAKIKDIISTLTADPDVRAFANGWFQRNNWKDSLIVPRVQPKFFFPFDPRTGDKADMPIGVDTFGNDIYQYISPAFIHTELSGLNLKPSDRKVLFLSEIYNASDVKYDVVTIPRIMRLDNGDLINITTGRTVTGTMYAQRKKKGDMSLYDVFGYQKVKYADGSPVITSKGEHVYKLVNLYGDGQYGSEYYNTFKPSEMNNGTVKIDNEIPDNDIIKFFGTKIETPVEENKELTTDDFKCK